MEAAACAARERLVHKHHLHLGEDECGGEERASERDQKERLPFSEGCGDEEVELEHGTLFEDANVTNNHPILTGMIVLAHMKETRDYYQRLEVAECDGELTHAILAGDTDRIVAKFKALNKGQAELNKAVFEQIDW